MKTYEGRISIWWHKNLAPSVRPITIDCEDREQLQAELSRVKKEFMTLGEDPEVADIFGTQQYIGVAAIKVTFDISERR